MLAQVAAGPSGCGCAVTPTTGDRGRLAAGPRRPFAKGEELLMGRSVWRRQEHLEPNRRLPLGGSTPCSNRFKPRRRPVPDARCCPTMDFRRESAVPQLSSVF